MMLIVPTTNSRMAANATRPAPLILLLPSEAAGASRFVSLGPNPLPGAVAQKGFGTDRSCDCFRQRSSRACRHAPGIATDDGQASRVARPSLLARCGSKAEACRAPPADPTSTTEGCFNPAH